MLVKGGVNMGEFEGGKGGYGGGFAFIIVLFILLVIIGASYVY
ncbi:YjcZ family sporulation protein [Alkalicoccobacillus porphyridii]